MPKLSIIVPVYNVEQYLHKCIESILAQSFKDCELILVDDGSTDSCGAICDEFLAKDERVKVIHQDNQGVSVARNIGVQCAQGDYIGFVDGDDYIALDMFEGMMKYLETNNLDIVCADCYVVKNDKAKFKPRYTNNHIWDDGKAINEILQGTLDNAVWNKVYRYDVVTGIEFPKNRRYEDVATTYKFIYNAKRVGYISKPYYYYVKRKGNFISQSFNIQSRYEHFLGYKERYYFANENKLSCEDVCEKIALEVALSALTAFYANNIDENDAMLKEIVGFIKEHCKSGVVGKLKRKHRILIWSFKNCKAVHQWYALLSKWSKRF